MKTGLYLLETPTFNFHDLRSVKSLLEIYQSTGESLPFQVEDIFSFVFRSMSVRSAQRFIGHFLSLDMKNAKSFIAFCSWYGVEGFLMLLKPGEVGKVKKALPWGDFSPGNVQAQYLYENLRVKQSAFLPELLNHYSTFLELDRPPWTPDSVAAVMRACRSYVEEAQTLFLEHGRTAQDEWIPEVVTIFLEHHTQIRLRRFLEDDKVYYELALSGKDVLGAAAIAFLYLGMLGKEIVKRPLSCSECGKKLDLHARVDRCKKCQQAGYHNKDFVVLKKRIYKRAWNKRLNERKEFMDDWAGVKDPASLKKIAKKWGIYEPGKGGRPKKKNPRPSQTEEP